MEFGGIVRDLSCRPSLSLSLSVCLEQCQSFLVLAEFNLNCLSTSAGEFGESDEIFGTAAAVLYTVRRGKKNNDPVVVFSLTLWINYTLKERNLERKK